MAGARCECGEISAGGNFRNKSHLSREAWKVLRRVIPEHRLRGVGFAFLVASSLGTWGEGWTFPHFRATELLGGGDGTKCGRCCAGSGGGSLTWYRFQEADFTAGGQ